MYIYNIFPHLIYIYIVYYIILQNDLVALLLNGIRYDRLGESGSKTAGGYQVNYCNMSMISTLNVICDNLISLINTVYFYLFLFCRRIRHSKASLIRL